MLQALKYLNFVQFGGGGEGKRLLEDLSVLYFQENVNYKLSLYLIKRHAKL